MTGLACARVMRRAGFYVEVFERDRVIGGRIATLRIGTSTFDHGAQYITARSEAFTRFVNELAGNGYVARWMPRATRSGEEGGGQMTPWYVGVPGMASILRPLAEGVRIHSGCTVHTIGRAGKGWQIWFEDQSSVGPFAAIAIALPAPQARLILGPLDELAEPLSRARMSPIWALTVRVDGVTLPAQDVWSDMSEVIRWIARNQTKPGRSSRAEHIVVHASQAWSREAEDADPDAVANELWGETSHILGLPPVRPAQMSAFLWRQGLVDQPIGESCVFSSTHRVGVAGDWCLGRLAEHAFESGSSLGRAIVSSLT
jgi:renalase